MDHDQQYFSHSTPTSPPPHHYDVVTADLPDPLSATTWPSVLLTDAARAVANKNHHRLNHLMWVLNELSSPYGDTNQKLSSYFLRSLFTHVTNSGHRCYHSLSSTADKILAFESTIKLELKFQQVSPWTTFGHVACNAAIMEAFAGEKKLHIVDVSTTFCTQWSTFMDAIATRTNQTQTQTPHLRLTAVIATRHGGAGVQTVMREIGDRMEKFARLMGVSFTFNLLHHGGDLSELDMKRLDVKDDEALAVNFNGTLRSVCCHRRDYLLSMFHGLKPKILTIVEEEADLNVGVEFLKGFEECLRWFRVYFEVLDESFPATSNERLMLERSAGRAVVDLVACSPAESVERRETAVKWSRRLHASGFSPVCCGDEVSDDVVALLRRYREGWSMGTAEMVAGMFLRWKGTPVVWASAWKPI
ncbi:hypothetical protein L6452_41139 [Arctium lappa]|uniref:Uncharacterized protein n=1 Tax=Arctium lappa TaxID=4217 RepID=A0ACB8XSL6_ARCLA|nr:hypothetical protein L6452_41139 [Arctium lappa]